MIQSKENFQEILNKNPVGNSLFIDPAFCNFMIKESELNFIISDDNFTKSYFNAHVVSQVLKKGNTVVYLDIDTIFSVFLKKLVPNLINSDNLIIFTPNSNEIEKIIVKLCATNMPYLKLIVIDSLTILYHVLAKGLKSSIVNYRINFYLNLLKKFVTSFQIPIILTGMTRAKKNYFIESKTWLTSTADNKFLSNVLLKISIKDNYIQINVIKHNNSSLLGKVLLLPINFHI